MKKSFINKAMKTVVKRFLVRYWKTVMNDIKHY